MEKHEAIGNLSILVKTLVHAGINSKEKWAAWSKMEEKTLEELLKYRRKAGMPAASGLIYPFFHPELPLIGLNYGELAQLSLFRFPEGWTMPLRLSRGIIFDHDGHLVALPFQKFFNYGECEESTNVPETGFEATVKHDGHLGIIFLYKNHLVFTTHGSFVSRSAKLGYELFIDHMRKNSILLSSFKDRTFLVELIHPSTKVIVDYGGETTFKLIGATNLKTMHDYTYSELVKQGEKMSLQTSTLFPAKTVTELREVVKNPAVENVEGYVARWPDGKRVKFKYCDYLKRFAGAKVTLSSVMNKIMDGTFEKWLPRQKEEIQMKARDLSKKIAERNSKEELIALYKEMNGKEAPSSFKTICKKYLESKNANK